KVRAAMRAVRAALGEVSDDLGGAAVRPREVGNALDIAGMILGETELTLDKVRVSLGEAKDALGAVRVAVRDAGPSAPPRQGGYGATRTARHDASSYLLARDCAAALEQPRPTAHMAAAADGAPRRSCSCCGAKAATSRAGQLGWQNANPFEVDIEHA